MLVGAILFAILAGVSVFVWGDDNTYNNAEYGISFSYPETYTYEERRVGSDLLVIFTDAPEGSAPENGEGPPTMQLLIHPLGEQQLSRWIITSTSTNFQLSEPRGVMIAKSIGEKPGFAFSWDGLYRGRSAAVDHEGRGYLFSATFRDVRDQITEDFDELLTTVEFN